MSDQTYLPIALKIRKIWGSRVNYAAKPYLDYLCDSCNGIEDPKTAVLYFLSNASSFNKKITPDAADLKKQLKASVGIK